MPDLSPARQKMLATIGEARRNMIWEALCDSFPDRFRSREAIALVSAEHDVSVKTATCWLDALLPYWLQPGNSDLVKLASGVYSWLPADHPAREAL